ncbi:hypothetical protein PTTG_01019 [Puccinia triticina 1-1 BBBD Race 1]|uniref:CREG-like beta-barrel domain-containing protein n=2 Tax=Puccinia triticina TaxID=208348 RepID=A0A180GUY4_PUCT1|nr:uncharacterized protein PtA15_3A799 [Puccinia triticina]OAV96585.1 hypothetical protein PTTG_01019 [Puccinia triticina 1-1 BBBD Race 1]WAQ83429.1 hypothetical protein PtA15_3A799 [Puccinia triticina]
MMADLSYSTLLSTLLIGFLVSTAAHIPSQLTLFSNQFDYNNRNNTSSSSSTIHLSEAESNYLAATHARELIHYRSEGIGTLISNYPDNHPDPFLRGLPIGLQEYFAPYPNGDLVLLVLPISPIYGNVLQRKENSTMGLTLAINDELGTVQRKNAIWAANRRRVSVFGELEMLEEEAEQKEAKALYEKVHPDSTLWDGHGGPHASFWARLVVRKVYYFGGFGDRAAIGWLDLDFYRAGLEDSPETRRQAVCFHPAGINLYCEQPIDTDTRPELQALTAISEQPDLFQLAPQVIEKHSHHHHHHHHVSHHHHHHHHFHNSQGNQSSLLIDSKKHENENYPRISEEDYTSTTTIDEDSTM